MNTSFLILHAYKQKFSYVIENNIFGGLVSISLYSLQFFEDIKYMHQTLFNLKKYP